MNGTMTVADLIVAEFGGPISFWFNKLIGRYINAATGRLVSEKKVLEIGEKFTSEYIAPRIKSITEKFIAGSMDIATWQEKFALELKNSYIVNAALGKGGRANMNPADWGRLGGRLNFQYRHLEGFAQEIKAGQLSDAQILFRAQMYANSARTAYYDGLTAAKKEAEQDLERRLLGPAEHCEDCIGYADMGWQPIGTLPEPGEGSVCRANCQCTKEYATEAEKPYAERVM